MERDVFGYLDKDYRYLNNYIKKINDVIFTAPHSAIIEGEIDRAFNEIRILGNKAAHANVEGELETALRIHRNIYKITCWFVETYIDHDFQTEPYKSPAPNKEKASQIDMELVTEIIKKLWKILRIIQMKAVLK